MKFFREQTGNQSVIMGRKNIDALVKPLTKGENDMKKQNKSGKPL